jgi:hypothetical protein
MTLAAWLDLSNPTSGQIAAGAAVIEACAVIGALLYARWQLRHSRDAQAAQDRPQVIVDFELAERNPHLADLIIRNIGRTAAHDVRFEFDPRIKTAMEPWVEESPLDIGIAMLAPQRRVRIPFDDLIRRHKAELPDRYEVTISYVGGGRKPNERHVDPPYTLDLRLVSRLPVPWPKGINEVADALEDIKRTTERWTAWGTAGRDGLLVRTAAEVEAETKAMLRDHSVEPPVEETAVEPAVGEGEGLGGDL